MSTYNFLVEEKKDGVRILTLNRPERMNALGIPLMQDLKNALQQANADQHCNVIVLRGAGPAFCAGKDLKEHEQVAGNAQAAEQEIGLLHDVSREILFSEKLFIAGVHGWAVGGGLELMIDCDLAILEEGTKMFFPEMSLGLFVTCGVTVLLPELIGLAQSRALIFGGEHIDAQRASQLGLAWKVYSREDFSNRLLGHADELAKLPQYSIRQMKKLMGGGYREKVERALQREAEIAVHCVLRGKNA